MDEFKILYIQRIAHSFKLACFFNAAICDFVACQFALESDFGTSDLAVGANNHSGMKVPSRRICSNIGSYKGFSKYENLDQCIQDFILWVFYNRPSFEDVGCVSSFIGFLKRKGYCPDDGYTQAIYSLYKSYLKSISHV